jgi:hypothetical protein
MYSATVVAGLNLKIEAGAQMEELCHELMEAISITSVTQPGPSI